MIKKVLKLVITLFLIPVVYLLLSLILTFIPVNGNNDYIEKNNSIFLNSNGIHLDIIIPKDQIDSYLLDGLEYSKKDKYFSFGWGDKNFYFNTPTWNDLTFNNAFKAIFINNSTLIHLTKYSTIQKDWVEIKVNQDQLYKINQYINKTFNVDTFDEKVLLKSKGYTRDDDFYEALGSFSIFKTCNSWVNSGLKKSDIKACLWTPFDFGLINMHK